MKINLVISNNGISVIPPINSHTLPSIPTFNLSTNPMPDSELYKDLQAAAFEVLLLHPGCGRQQWIDILCSQYAEAYDAYGDDAGQRLLELWHQPYRDIASGIENTYETWSQMFSTEEDARKYYDMIKDKQTN